ncbi:MAG TPA: HAD-IIIC family phosphatase [Streptosporangiaceae bacterium]
MQTTAAEDDTLLELHRAGKLVSQYPAVAGMLAGLSESQLLTAGKLLSGLDPDEVAGQHPAVPVVRVAITGHGTLAPLVPPLTAELARHGLLARVFVSDFGSYVFDLGKPESALYRAGPDLILCLLDPMMIFDELPVPWRVQDAERALHEKHEMISRLVAGFRAASRGTLVLNTMPLLRRSTSQIVDHRSRARLGAAWRDANARLLRLAEENPAVVVLDLDPLIAEGIAAEDPRLSIYVKAHLSPQLLARYAREIGHLARHITGQTKKVLALDLDGTLWGGVLGEDGPEGIQVAGGYRGEAFRAFQRTVKQLGAQGVLLAVVSKNDKEPVHAVFTSHPDMTLREDDFVRIVANWQPKHANITRLASDLNLGVDSFVFVDDTAAECGLVRHALPGVTVIEVGSEPARHIERMLRDGWFDTCELTAEDRTRAARYQDELTRKDFQEGFDSAEEYLRELQVTVRLTAARDDETARISQLTLRTNQFNLTTRRIQPAELRDLLTDPAVLVVTITSGDRFGENGLVGAVFLRRDGDAVHIDNFLLSCRVFSRGIEQACLAAILKYARGTGAARVVGSYRATAKNEKVKDFYPHNGFAQITANSGTATFCHDLTEIPAVPDHILLNENLTGSGR